MKKLQSHFSEPHWADVVYGSWAGPENIICNSNRLPPVQEDLLDLGIR